MSSKSTSTTNQLQERSDTIKTVKHQKLLIYTILYLVDEDMQKCSRSKINRVTEVYLFKLKSLT